MKRRCAQEDKSPAASATHSFDLPSTLPAFRAWDGWSLPSSLPSVCPELEAERIVLDTQPRTAGISPALVSGPSAPASSDLPAMLPALPTLCSAADSLLQPRKLQRVKLQRVCPDSPASRAERSLHSRPLTPGVSHVAIPVPSAPVSFELPSTLPVLPTLREPRKLQGGCAELAAGHLHGAGASPSSGLEAHKRLVQRLFSFLCRIAEKLRCMELGELCHRMNDINAADSLLRSLFEAQEEDACFAVYLAARRLATLGEIELKSSMERTIGWGARSWSAKIASPSVDETAATSEPWPRVFARDTVLVVYIHLLSSLPTV